MPKKRTRKGKVRNAQTATSRRAIKEKTPQFALLSLHAATDHAKDGRRRKTQTNRFAKLRGRATLSMTTEKILALTRDI